MEPLFITAVIWFFAGILFQRGLVWYDERQKRKAWHAGLDRFLRQLGEASRHDIDVVTPPIKMVDTRKEEVVAN
jgi:hypothetical protein